MAWFAFKINWKIHFRSKTRLDTHDEAYVHVLSNSQIWFLTKDVHSFYSVCLLSLLIGSSYCSLLTIFAIFLRFEYRSMSVYNCSWPNFHCQTSVSGFSIACISFDSEIVLIRRLPSSYDFLMSSLFCPLSFPSNTRF